MEKAYIGFSQAEGDRRHQKADTKKGENTPLNLVMLQLGRTVREVGILEGGVWYLLERLMVPPAFIALLRYICLPRGRPFFPSLLAR